MVKKVSESESDKGVVESGTGFFKITSMDFLFLEVSLGLILYPGSHAYITEDQRNLLPEYSLSMVSLSEITEKEYKSKIGSQGLLGLG